MYTFGVVGETHAHDYFEVVSFYNNILRYIIARILRHMHVYRNFSIKPPRGLIFSPSFCEGGLLERGGIISNKYKKSDSLLFMNWFNFKQDKKRTNLHCRYLFVLGFLKIVHLAYLFLSFVIYHFKFLTSIIYLYILFF